MQENISSAVDEIIESARAGGVTVRVLGGAAIMLRCPSASHRALSRKVPDIDLIALKKDSRKLTDLLIKLGAEPIRMFNALHGDKRMLFTDAKNGRQVDVFLDRFEMCHTFDFRDRMRLDERTLPLADLLMTKLQIIEINEKDYKDLTCLLLDHPLSESDDDRSINAAYVASLCSGDWGIYRTFTRNLDWLKTFVKESDLEQDKRGLVLSRIDALLARIEKEPKSMRWKMRAKIGDKVAWYDTPERVGKITTD